MMERDQMSGSHDCGGDAAAYVLGALEGHELEAFRAHLEQCAVCRDEVDAFGGVVNVLPIAAPQQRASRSLRRRVMRDVRQESRRAAHSARPMRSLPALGGRGWAAAGTACAVVAAAVVVGLNLGGGGGATVFPARVSRIAGTAQLRLTNGHAELVVHHLTPPGRRRVYEVWLQHGNAAPVPASVLFGVNSTGDADIGLPTNLHGVSAVLVTSEPLGGTNAPTRNPVIVARLD
jgi:anti-sigma-K factor RskA